MMLRSIFATLFGLAATVSANAQYTGTPGNLAWFGSTGTLSDSQTSLYNAGGGLKNILSFACGITIGDGLVHTVSTAPAGSCFSGVTTLAGLAAINFNGIKPFSFLTDSGAVTGPLCTNGGTTNCFTSTSGSYRLTDASVAKLDIAWLAIQAAEMMGRTYIPAGHYIIGSSLPLPIMIPSSGEGSGAVEGAPSTTRGDGQRLSILTNGSDFGAGVPLVVCQDPAATLANRLGRFGSDPGCSGDLRDLGIRSSVNGYSSPGVVPVQMDGLAWGPRLRLTDLEVSFWNHDMTAVGDHTLWNRLHLLGGYKGLEWLAPAGNYGDNQTVDFVAAGQSFAAISVAPGGAFMGITMGGETYLSAPVAIYGEADAGCNALMGGVIIDRLFTEYNRVAFIWDATGFNGTVYTDSHKCRQIVATTIKHWFGSFITDQDSYWASQNIYRRASIDVGGLSLFRIDNITPSGGGMMPNYAAASSNGSPGPIVNSHAIAFINATTMSNTLVAGVRMGGDIGGLIAQAQNVPLYAGGSYESKFFEVDVPGAWSGYMEQLTTAGNYTATRAGDCMETNYYGVAPCGTSANVARPSPRGIAMQSGIMNNGYVPVAVHGGMQVPVNIGYASANWGYWRPSYGVGPISFVAGSGGITGTYTFTATGGGCSVEPTGSITVTGGMITSATETNSGNGCTSQPVVAVPGGASLKGASITLQWPSGEAVAASGLTDGPLLGQAVSSAGNSSSGNGLIFLNLEGLD